MRSLAALGVENAQITSRRRPSSRGRDPTMSSRSAASAPRWKGHNRRCTASNRAKGTPMNKPTTELAYRDRVTGLQLTVDGSMQKVGMPKTDPPACAAIGCTVVDVVRLTDQLNMWSDDEGLYNSQANPHHQTGAPLPARHPTSLPPALLRHHDDPRFRTGSLAARGRPGLRGGTRGMSSSGGGRARCVDRHHQRRCVRKSRGAVQSAQRCFAHLRQQLWAKLNLWIDDTRRV